MATLSSRKLYNLIDASYKTNEEASKIGHDNGLMLDNELSNRQHKVFRDKHNNSLIAFTGSRAWEDIYTDGLLAVGLGEYSNRFKNSSLLVDKVRKKYNNAPITTLGHSLGGRLSEYVNDRNFVDKTITVNKGTGIFDIGKRIQPNQTDIHSNTDWVSLIANSQSGANHVNNPGTLIFDPLYSHSYSQLKKFGKHEKF